MLTDLKKSLKLPDNIFGRTRAMKRLWCLVGILSCFTLSCTSSGSSSGGGGGSLQSVTYSEKDMDGTWNYSASMQGKSRSCSGSMTFSSAARLTGFTNSCCSGNQIVNAEFWIFKDGYVKGRNYAWCGESNWDGNPMLKYSMNFTGPDKQTISGIVDLHYTDADYDRFSVTLTRQVPVNPTPPNPEDNALPQGKRSVKVLGLSGVPAKR
jgi:hypothetical protein